MKENREEIKKRVEKALQNISEEEHELLEDAIEKYPEIIDILFKGGAQFTELTRYIFENERIKFPTKLTFYLKKLNQLLLIGPVYALRGNIRACMMSTRPALEIVCILLYLLENDNEIENLLKENDTMSSENNDEFMKGGIKVNDKLKQKAYKYVEQEHPNECTSLKRYKYIINIFFAHGSFFMPDLSLDAIEHKEGRTHFSMSVVDSERDRDFWLRRTIMYSFVGGIHPVYVIICNAIEKKYDCDMSEFRNNINEMKDLMQKF